MLLKVREHLPLLLWRHALDLLDDFGRAHVWKLAVGETDDKPRAFPAVADLLAPTGRRGGKQGRPPSSSMPVDTASVD